MSLTVRAAGSGDVQILAGLHVESWRSAYRGILTDAFLAREVEAERRAFWATRMAAWNPARSFAEIAELDGTPVAFACVMRDAEPAHGALLDNLHVVPARRGTGIGRRLLADAAAWVARHFPGTPLHLTVYEANEAARAFYRRMGGAESAPFEGLGYDGRMHRERRFTWAEPGNVR
jgi:GNAT superfamily N-acetyltransferase